ncbi:hypothetical protein MHYP_G00305060 [Metynnis hypsauchen]
MASKPFSFQTRLSSVMEVMARAVVREVCEMVDGDLACLRLELARALNEKAALSVKMRELESELETLRNTGARSPAKKYRSICIQTLEELDAPSINGIFGKEWCSSLWDGREPRAEEKATEVEPAVPDESELHDHSKTLAIKEENSEKEICSSNTTAAATPGRRNNPSSPSEPNDVLELSLIDDGDDDNQDSEDIYFISAGFLEAPDVHPMPSGFERSDFTKIISSDGTVKHLILPSDDQLEFDEHCMPIEFIEGEHPEAQAFGGQQEDLFLEAENTSSLGSAENLTYFDRFDLQEEPEREMELAKTPKFSCMECGKTFLRQKLSLIDDGDDDNQDSEDIYFISAGFLEAPDVHPMPSGFERSDFTKIISSDGTVKHLILPSDDQLEFDEHCMPIEFIEGEHPEAQAFGGQQEDLFLEAENTSSLGSAENLTYFDRFDLQEDSCR